MKRTLAALGRERRRGKRLLANERVSQQGMELLAGCRRMNVFSNNLTVVAAEADEIAVGGIVPAAYQRNAL